MLLPIYTAIFMVGSLPGRTELVGSIPKYPVAVPMTVGDRITCSDFLRGRFSGFLCAYW